MPYKSLDERRAWAARYRGRATELAREAYRKDPERFRRHARNGGLRKKYGIDQSAYNVMLKRQNGLCAVCFGPPLGGNKRVDHCLHVDHDHQTGAVRALLCHDCNSALGRFRDDPQLCRAAAEYLELHRAVPKPRVRATKNAIPKEETLWEKN